MPPSSRRLILLLPLAACATAPGAQPIVLPRPVQRPGGPEPTPEVIVASQQAFANPASFIENPAATATALWQLEYLTEIMAVGGFYRSMDPGSAVPLRNGRDQARAAFGIRPDAPPQLAVDQIYAAAVALQAKDNTAALTALRPILVPGAEATVLARLSNPPPLPAAREGTEAAWLALQRSPQIFYNNNNMNDRGRRR
jgi:hypothetical protein